VVETRAISIELGQCFCRSLTEISDTVSDHDTLQVDLGLAMLLELEIAIRYSRSEEREVPALSNQLYPGYIENRIAYPVRLARHVERPTLELVKGLEELSC
jgi:hypothetical protein